MVGSAVETIVWSSDARSSTSMSAAKISRTRSPGCGARAEEVLTSPNLPMCAAGQPVTTAQSAYPWSCQLSAVASTSDALTYHCVPLESGKLATIETLLAPLPSTRAPPPIAFLGEGQLTSRLFELAELDAVVTSTRWRPLTPDEPAGPCGPWGPVAPVGSCPGAKSDLSNEPFRTLLETTAFAASFGVETAPFLSCAVPTLARGSATAAAKLVPPSATASATHATTSAGDGCRTE